MARSEKYIPAFGHDWLTPLYDPFLRWGMREDVFKRALVRQAQIRPGHRVLDLGCGTATLTILLKQLHPEAVIAGLDGDERVLEIGRAKASKAGIDITLDHGMAFQLPYPDNSFDRVVSSLVMHHLSTEDKRRTANEAFRILRPGGELHVVDFGKPHNAAARLMGAVAQHLERAADNIQGRLPEMFRAAGFVAVEETARYFTLVGTLSAYRAVKPR